MRTECCRRLRRYVWPGRRSARGVRLRVQTPEANIARIGSEGSSMSFPLSRAVRNRLRSDDTERLLNHMSRRAAAIDGTPARSRLTIQLAVLSGLRFVKSVELSTVISAPTQCIGRRSAYSSNESSEWPSSPAVGSGPFTLQGGYARSKTRRIREN